MYTILKKRRKGVDRFRGERWPKNLSDYTRRKTSSEKDIQRRKLFYQIGEQVFKGESKMGINKKYLLSLGVAYYPEKMVRLQKQASSGWHFVKMNRLGFEVYQRRPRNDQICSRLFEGEPSEIVDYLAMYQAGGWTYISNIKIAIFILKRLLTHLRFSVTKKAIKNGSIMKLGI